MDTKKYTTIPLEAVNELYSNLIPVTITYLEKDLYEYNCNIKEFAEYDCPYWASLDLERAFIRPEDVKGEANGIVFLREPIKAYILQHAHFGDPVEKKVWKKEELEDTLIPTLFLSRLPFGLNNGTDIFPKEYAGAYFDAELKKEEEKRGLMCPDGLRAAPHPQTLDIDIDTFCKAYNLYRYPEAYRSLLYDSVQNLKLRPLKFEDNEILNTIFYHDKPIKYHSEPSILNNVRAVPIKHNSSLSEEYIMNAIESGNEDFI